MTRILKHLRERGNPYLGKKLADRTGAAQVLTSPAIKTGHDFRNKRPASAKRCLPGDPTNVGKLTILPYLDERSGETGAHRAAYKQMLKEPSVKAALLSKCWAVASLDIAVIPRDQKDPRQKEIADFCLWNLQQCGQGVPGATVGVPALVENICLPKLIEGYVLAHKRIADCDGGEYSGKWRLAEVIAKPSDTYTIHLDEYQRAQCVEGRMHNNGEFYDMSLFVYSRHLPLWDSPIGMSDLRAAYRAYWLKDTAWKLRGIYLEKFGTGFLSGTYERNDQKGTLELAMKASRNATWIAVPKGVELKAIDIATRGSADYAAAIRDLDHEIFVGIAGAFLQSGEGSTTGSYGMGKVHKSTAELFVWYLAQSLAGDINGQIIPYLCDLNFFDPQPYPQVVFGGINDEEMAQSIVIDQGLYNVGFPLSVEDMALRYGRRMAKDDSDRLKPATSSMPASGVPAALPFRVPSF